MNGIRYNIVQYHRMTVLLEYINRSLQSSINAINLLYMFPNMLALCLMLSKTHYAQNYAGIIERSLSIKAISSTSCI